MNTYPCTPFIEEGTLALRQKGEYRTDKDLYHVIRLQRIIENIDKIASSKGDAQSAYLRVRAELEEFRAYLCSDVSDSRKSSQVLYQPHLPTKHVP
jgi:3-methyladenine DNA glycosylase Tag